MNVLKMDKQRGRFEIHSHSTVSDGKFRPEVMAEAMAEAGVDLWALTDHDNVEGCESAERSARERGVEFISGIEISAHLEGDSIHVLGYGFDRSAPELASYGTQMVRARRERMGEMVERLRDLGLEITLEEVLSLSTEGNVGRPHLARALVKKGYVDQEQAAFDRWLAQSRPGYVAMKLESVERAIALIREAGGMVVLAHPARYGDLCEHLDRWKELGLWGLEVRHPSHSGEDEKRLIRLADARGLGKTASNDWHGGGTESKRRLGKVRFPQDWTRGFFRELAKTYEGERLSKSSNWIG